MISGSYVRFALVLMLASCDGDQFEQNSNSQTQAIDQSVLRTTEDPLLNIASRWPRFGGYHCDNGNLVVLIQGHYSAVESLSLQELLPVNLPDYCRLRSNPDHVPQVEFRESKYSFLVLKAWRDSISSEFLDMEGAISIGINYRRGRLLMRVRPEYNTVVAGPIHSRAASHGIPNDGYEIVDATPRKPNNNCSNSSNGPVVNNCFRPVPAGIHVNMTSSGGTQDYGGCTLGSANDRYMPSLNTWLPGYTTNSHCTPQQFNMQSDWAWQGITSSGGDVVAIEAVDPAGWRCGALGAFTCRYSDSAWLQAWAPGGSTQHGTIARTTYATTVRGTKGSTTIDSYADRFYIDGEGTIIEDMQVDKVGAVTGWTTGAITDTCSDEPVYDANNHRTTIRLLCQVSATYYVEGGDSGSPVFFWRYWEGSTVELLGIHWGGCYYPEICDSSFSPQDSIEAELGTLYISYPYF